MSYLLFKDASGDSWVRTNMKHKMNGNQMLALTGLRGRLLKAHWLTTSGDIAEESLQWEGPGFPSLSRFLPEAAWDEREIHDLFGYVPDGHPELRPLVRTPRWPKTFFPLQDDADSHPHWRDVEPDNPSRIVEGDGVTVMKVGPTHAGIIESGHFVFSIMGENILHLDAHLFQNHRGMEKVLETRLLGQVPALVSRICGADSVSHQFNFVSAVEQLAGRRAPEAVQWDRILLLESERILSHLNDLAQIPAGVGFQVANQRGLAMKEKWQRGLAAIFGHRFLFDTLDFDREILCDKDGLRTLVRSLEQSWSQWRRLVDHHRGFHDRMQGVGVVRQSDAERLGAAGVAARASGLGFDARTLMPLYQGIEVEPARADGGDVEARFQIRLQEVESSVRILKIALDQVSVTSSNSFWQPPCDLSGDVVSYSESPHGLNAHMIRFEDGRIQRYHVRSGAFRNWPVLALAVAGNAVADFPLINKSFELCYSCSDR